MNVHYQITIKILVALISIVPYLSLRFIPVRILVPFLFEIMIEVLSLSYVKYFYMYFMIDIAVLAEPIVFVDCVFYKFIQKFKQLDNLNPGFK